MKKLLIISTLIFCSFFIIDKVGATSVTMYYDSDYVQDDIIDKTDINYINDTLIPFIEQNFQNYFVYIGLQYTNSHPNYTRGIIYIMPRNTANNGATFMFARPSYTNQIDFFPYTTIDDDFVVSGRVRNYHLIDFRTDNHNTFPVEGSINIVTYLTNWLNSPTYNHSNQFNTLTILPSCPNNSCDINFLDQQRMGAENLPYYINYPSIIATTLAYQDYQGDYIVNYEDIDYTFELGDPFPTYYFFTNLYLTPPNQIITFDNDTFGFYNNIVDLQNLGSNNDLFSIICDTDKPFQNDYCSMNYLDLLSNNSDINYYSNSLFNFHMLFTSDNSNLLRDNTYYAYSFRLQQPFHPNVGGIVLNTNKGDFYFGDTIDKIYLNDGGSYTDYVVIFHTSNNNFVSSDKINFISIYFREPLSYYYKVVPESFNFSVYRSSKLKMFNSMPSADDINSFISYNDLSSINSNAGQNSFFTDTQFKTYGFGGIVTAPFRLLYAILDYDTCSTINLPFPHSSNSIGLTCVRSSIPSGLSPLISLLQIFLSGIICYRIAVGTLSTIKQIFDPANNSIEVVDL